MQRLYGVMTWVCIPLACLFGLSGPFPLFLYLREKSIPPGVLSVGQR